GERQRDRRVGHRQRLSQRRGGRAREELRGAQLHSGEASKRAAQLAGQSRGTTGGVQEPAAGARRLRQELTAAARRVGGTQLRALLRHRRHEAHAPARTPKHSKAAVGSCRRVQPEPDPAPVAGCGHAAGVEKPVWPASFAGLFPAHATGSSELALQKSNLNVRREILGEPTNPSTPLAVPKISCLHHRLLDQFPSAGELWARYRAARGYTASQEAVATQDYYGDGSGKVPRYYQLVAINRAVDAIARGENRILLVMATGTGKTYTAFQIIWRLWKSGAKKRILFLVDRNILADQTKTNDFKPFGQAMTKITHRTADKAFEVYLSLYQAVTGTEEEQNIYKQFSPDFFDLVVIDECHRGSAADDAAWRKVLEYFSSATQIGMTATPRETKDISNIEYFGEPIYTYSLRQGISDGFLAPYKVVRIGIDKDLDGWRPERGQTDRYGHEIEDRQYNDSDFDRNLVLKKRTELVSDKITRFLKATDRFAKTIVFCEDIDHAERMRQALVNANPDLAAVNSKYVMRITGDSEEGKAQLDNFIDPESTFPVIACTSRLMSTGVDAQTCQLIVLDRRIASMTEFKQIIGRGTRINEDYHKLYFTIMDFKRATALFADPDFDGDPVQIYEPKE